MARVNRVAKAAKPNKCGKCGEAIPVGSAYTWWKFRHGGKYVRCLKCPPKGSDLTQSAFYGTLCDLEERYGAITAEGADPSDVANELNDLAGEARDLGETCQENLDNMPEGLQQGSTGELLQERVDACESLADALEDLASQAENLEAPEEPEEESGDERNAYDKAREELDTELRGILDDSPDFSIS